MKHIYFTTPFLWNNLPGLELEDKVITWLMAIPISDNEFDFLIQNGSESLEGLFEEKNINIFDINRKSII